MGYAHRGRGCSMGFWDIIFGPNNNKKVLWRLNQIMGRLDAVKAALDLAGSTAADEAAQVAAHFARLSEQVATLQATIDDLVANQVTDAEIEALRVQADALSATVEAIDTEGDVAPEPEPTPEPEPESEQPPVV